jgi:hypothetical protein
MGCFCLNVAFLSLIIKGIMYYSDTTLLSGELSELSQCFVKEEHSALSNLSTAVLDISFGYILFMGIVGLLIFLITILLVVVKLI